MPERINGQGYTVFNSRVRRAGDVKDLSQIRSQSQIAQIGDISIILKYVILNNSGPGDILPLNKHQGKEKQKAIDSCLYGRGRNYMFCVSYKYILH